MLWTYLGLYGVTHAALRAFREGASSQLLQFSVLEIQEIKMLSMHLDVCFEPKCFVTVERFVAWAACLSFPHEGLTCDLWGERAALTELSLVH